MSATYTLPLLSPQPPAGLWKATAAPDLPSVMAPPAIVDTLTCALATVNTSSNKTTPRDRTAGTVIAGNIDVQPRENKYLLVVICRPLRTDFFLQKTSRNPTAKELTGKTDRFIFSGLSPAL